MNILNPRVAGKIFIRVPARKSAQEIIGIFDQVHKVVFWSGYLMCTSPRVSKGEAHRLNVSPLLTRLCQNSRSGLKSSAMPFDVRKSSAFPINDAIALRGCAAALGQCLRVFTPFRSERRHSRKIIGAIRRSGASPHIDGQSPKGNSFDTASYARACAISPSYAMRWMSRVP